ncbi:MAG: methyltransferase, partial [Tsuneonella sp.]
MAGFIYSQVLWVYVETGLIGFLADAPRSSAEVREFLGIGREASDRLLAAGRSLDIAETPQADVWTLGEGGAALSANSGAMAMIRHHQLLYRDLVNPLALLAGESRAATELAQFWTYSPGNADQVQRPQPYSELMAATQPMIWGQILTRYPFVRHRRMLDVGGGSGAFVEAVAQVASKLELGVFDLPAVTPLAQARFDRTALADRVTIHSGSFRDDALPT